MQIWFTVLSVVGSFIFLESCASESNEGTKVSIRSEGEEDPKLRKDDGAVAYIWVNGRDESLHNRGYNVVVLHRNGTVASKASFDTFGDSGASNQMLTFMSKVLFSQIVLVAIQDEASEKISSDAYNALKLVGAVDYTIAYRTSYALIGYKGGTRPSWVKESKHQVALGPTILTGTVPFKDPPVPTPEGLPGPVAVYPLTAKYLAYPVSPYNVPPGKIVGATLADGPDGNPGGSYYFAGTSANYIEFPSGSQLDIRYSITIVVNIYPEAPGPIVDYGPAEGTWFVCLWMSAMTHLFWNVQKRGTTEGHMNYQPVLAINQWNFVAATYNFITGLSEIWLEGKKVGETNPGIMEIATNEAIRMGAKPNDDRYFKGRISCLQFYNRALSQAEIVAARTKCQNIDPPSPVAIYPLDLQHGATPLTPSFAPPGVAVGIQYADGPNGKPGGSSVFSGSSTSYIEIPKDERLDTRYAITILAMVYAEVTEGPLVQFVHPSHTYGPHFWVSSSGTALFSRLLRRDFTPTESIQSFLLKPRQWFYVGTTYDYSNGVLRNWINGKMVTALTVGSMEIVTNAMIRMGTIPADARYFKGRISCLQIYKQALTSEQIIAAKNTCSDYKRSPYSMCHNYITISGSSRAVEMKVSPLGIAADHNVLSEHKWYRFDGSYSGQMPTTCVPENSCGTQSPGWLRGLHPSRESGAVKREVCFRSGTNCCVRNQTIYVRQCVGFFVFLFPEVPLEIKGRYCVEQIKANSKLELPPVAKVFTADAGPILVDHVIYTEDHVKDASVCAGYCSLNSECKSFNYNSHLSMCEISNTTRQVKEAPARKGFLYYEPVKAHAFNHELPVKN